MHLVFHNFNPLIAGFQVCVCQGLTVAVQYINSIIFRWQILTLFFPDSKYMFAKASQLPGVLEGELQYLEGQQQLLEKDKQSRKRQFWQYYKVMDV